MTSDLVIVLDMTLKTQATKETIDNLDLKI